MMHEAMIVESMLVYYPMFKEKILIVYFSSFIVGSNSLLSHFNYFFYFDVSSTETKRKKS